MMIVVGLALYFLFSFGIGIAVGMFLGKLSKMELPPDCRW